ncbi:hypothetical protein BU15DRAFT_62151 [Melanogaster broomeanus]|nr:hypothetical protein BU15DRAFT_62151 [Melanogaster broomeanus]
MLCFLPAELMETIFDEFDVPSLLRCLQVCKLFHAIISQSMHLLYKIELFGSHVDDGRHSDLDIANRSRLLGSYNRVWREMRWAGCKEVPIENGLSWHLVGGVLAHALFDDHSISFVQLPCSIKGIPEKQWTTHLGVKIRDFYFDVVQDLLVCIEVIGVAYSDEEICKIHFFTLSTGTPHTLACTPTITHQVQRMPTWTEPRFIIQICGPRVVILFQDGAYCASSVGDFVAWNWRTGEREMFIQCAELRSFSMLTEDLILAVTVPMPCEPSLDVLSISECQHGPAATPNSSPLQFADIPCICGFQLPRVRGNDLDIFIRSEPSPLATPSPSLRVPFSMSQRDCLYVVALRCQVAYFTRSVVLMALRSTFLARAIRNRGGDDNVKCGIDTTSCLDETVPANPSQVIPWQDWGPTGTRILPLDPSDSWFCYTHDTKYIHPVSENVANLYDFNPYAIRRHPRKSPQAAHDGSMWTPLELESKIMAKVSFFLEDVTTRLPGSIAHVELQELARVRSIPGGSLPLDLGLMLAEDHIVVAVPWLHQICLILGAGKTIFDEFDVPSLLRCLQVCKLFHDVISESMHLLYKIELFGSHMDDGRHSGLDVVSRSKLLESYNQGWREMRWAGCKKVPKEEGSLSRDLIGGVLAHPLCDDHSISFSQLPCSIKGILEKQWTVDLGVEVRNFYFDVAQDLLVCVEIIGVAYSDEEICGIHFFTLSTGTPHTLACTPIITHRVQGMPAWIDPRFIIQICGPRVVILFQDGAVCASSVGDFVAWDWRTGEQEMFIQCAELRSFSMLTEDLILAATVPTPREPSLDVLSISACPRDFAATTNCSPPRFTDIPCICRFQLPSFQGDDLDICIRSEPSPLATPSPGLKVPFSTSQGDCLYVVSLRLENPIRTRAVVLMALRSTFLARANQNHEGEDGVKGGIDATLCLDETVPANPSQVIPWRDWVPPAHAFFSRILLTSGYIHPAPEERTNRYDFNTANLYDFNPYAVRRYRLPPKSLEAAHDNSMWAPLEFETKIRSEVSPFVEDVTTRLPGSTARVELQQLARIHFNRQRPLPLGPLLLGPMLAEDHIVVTAARLDWAAARDDTFTYFYM